jgi:hypothetical protein
MRAAAAAAMAREVLRWWRVRAHEQLDKDNG